MHVLKPYTPFDFTKSCLDEKKGALFNCFTVHYYFWYALGQTQTRTVSNNALWQCVLSAWRNSKQVWKQINEYETFHLHKNPTMSGPLTAVLFSFRFEMKYTGYNQGVEILETRVYKACSITSLYAAFKTVKQLKTSCLACKSGFLLLVSMYKTTA